MGTPGMPNFHGRQLLRELKRLREQTGMTQDEAGTRLHLTLQKLSRIENGQLPGYHETRAMLKLYGLTPEQCAPYLEQWERARKRGWWRQYGLRDSSYVCMEQEASRMFEFQLGRLPALLQTESYARRCLCAAVPACDAKEVEAAVAVRTRRQERLFDGEKPLVLHALVHEPTLCQGVDREQLILLVERAQMPNVTVRIVPQSAGPHSGLDGSVILLDFDDPQEPDIVFTDTVLGLAQSQDDSRTSAVRMTLEDLAARALSPEDSLDTLKSMIA
ncbi:transcriptional regulator with XRE-family HTH domain [Kibdelosporangium banguiense]|uniref:Transcriptional regulator with XRE-family HTH domain n=1 Tax=Kibdelosporangium banguiense TaxID=1365924 RepID=A0ABS4THU9_9PSEU|nr:helix-turn-helix transcriptional regulator [Kibdelosporangium banguiense]MBP2323916.1 transcriptional regulator with XRE-family HTH domain [Kibdelosporangium banguiense]